MDAELEVLTGPAQGQKHCLAGGVAATVGRVRGVSALAVPDPLLAPQHFTLLRREGGWMLRDDSAAPRLHHRCEAGCFVEALRNERCLRGFCRLYDMSGSNGVYVNGARVAEAPLAGADIIVAGSTAFRLNLLDGAPASEPPAPPEPSLLDPEQQARLLGYLRQHSMPLYAVLDAARDPQVLQMLQTHDGVYYSLYDGPEGDELAEVAPYLVRLEPDGLLLRDFVARGWGRAWGVLLYCAEDFKAVRRHLRHFLMVDTEGGDPMYFRFYDPRVLRTFLPTCDAAQLAEFFGPIATFVVEREPVSAAYLFAVKAGRLERATKDFETVG